MKKTGSFSSRATPKKQPDTKTSSLSRSTGKVGSGPGSAAFNRRSPVVTEGATIATSSVIQAATDPKIKELVMKQQQIFERESMDKRTPRNRETVSALFHSLDHPHTSPHHASSHGQTNLWKHTSFGDHAEHPQPNESLIPETPERLHGKFSAISPDAQQQQNHFFHHPTTPGSNVDTIVHPQEGHASGGQDDDGVSSELTSDATYMTLQRSSNAMSHLPTMSEHPVAASPAGHTAMSVSAGSPSMRGHQAMHAYMDLNAAMLHEHGTSSNGKDLLASPLTQVPGNNAHGLPMPPPLSLPQAASSGIAAEGVTPPTAYHASQSAAHGGLANLDPSVMDDQSLRTAYLRLLMEMETRGLHSLSLNPSQPGQSGANTAACTPAPISHTNSLGSSSNGNIQAGPQSATQANARRELQESPSLKLAPSTAHTTVPLHLNPNVNPVDIRKNVPRSKSGGSESAFYPNAMFPGASPTAAQAGANLSERNGASGRKTPNSPLMGRYIHTNAGTDTRDSLVEELHWAPEPEEVELRRAFGQHRHPGSPSYPAYSPFPHLSASVAAGHGPSSHAAHGGGAYHGTGNTPTSVAVGSANWSSTGSSAAPNAALTNAAASHGGGHGARPASRCSGVIPQLDHFDIHMRHNCLSTLPQTHSQYMYTHSVTAHVSATSTSTGNTSGGAANGTAASGASGTASGASGSGANARSVDLKTPKFVRKFQGIGAGSLGLTVQRYAHVEEGHEDSSVSASVDSTQFGFAVHHAAPQSQTHPSQGQTQGQQAKSRISGPSSSSAQGPTKQSANTTNGHINGVSTGHASTSTSRSAGHHHPLLSSSSDLDSTIDAVKIAGGLDQLLLPNRRSSKRNSSLIPDEHSAFDDCSLGSMSMNSARSAGKKSAKTR